MKIDKSIVVSFVLLVVIASLYRIMPGRPLGFAPQIAMALFGGSVIKDKKFAFILPLFSMFISDVMYETLYHFNLSATQGFYQGQVTNYLLFGAITVIGFLIKKEKVLQIAAGSIAGTAFYFLASNFVVWIGGGLALNNLPYTKDITGLTSCYTAGLPFLQGSLYATLLFSGILFGGFYLFNKYKAEKHVVA
ncbi:hypothetical protein BH11BAC3_BH11BAC3_34360 [soil metagenome]